MLKTNCSQGPFYYKKIVLQPREPFKIGLKPKQMSDKATNDTKGEIMQVLNKLWWKLFHHQLALSKGPSCDLLLFDPGLICTQKISK